MKAGIVTITNGWDNYGNVLQNYALQQFLNGLGITSETIRNFSFVERRIGGVYLIPRFFLKREETLKRIKFERFKKKYISYSHMIVTSRNRNLQKVAASYDLFICGSDQVWNPNFDFNHNWDLMLLKFVVSDKKISFAASFGVEEVNEDYASMFGENLKDFKALSVREESGCRLVKTLTQREAILLSDPAMLLTREKWDLLARPVKALKNRKFILLYWLGKQNEALSECLVRMHERYPEAEIVNPNSLGNKCYISDPGEFIWMIKNSEAVITDSFHATVFSILYNKHLAVIKRSGKADYMFNRLETLLKKYNVDNYVYLGGAIPEKTLDLNYVEYRLTEERKKAADFVLGAL